MEKGSIEKKMVEGVEKEVNEEKVKMKKMESMGKNDEVDDVEIWIK